MKTMTHLGEHILASLITDPQGLSDEERAAARAHLDSCAGCSGLYEEIRAVHEELHTGAPVSTAILEKAIHRIFAPDRVVRLVPFHPHLQVPAGSSYAGILAAMAPEQVSREGYETVATFASEVDHMLLRVRQDAGQRRVRLYFHTPDPAHRRGAVITLPALHADAVVDEQGRAEFLIDQPRTPRAWSQLEALVTFPVYSLRRTADGVVHRDLQAAHGYDVLLRQQDDRLVLHCTHQPDVPAIRRVVIWDADNRSMILDTPSDDNAFPDPSPGHTVVIHLYT